MHALRTTLALSLVLALPLDAQQRPDTVSLRFNWPVGMTAIVEQEFTRVNQTSTRNDSITVTSSYRLRVLKHPRGRLVVADSFRMGTVAGVPVEGAAAGNSDAQQMLSLVGNLQPSFVVSPEGEFLEVAQIDNLKSSLDSMIRMLTKDVSGGAPPELRAFLDRATSPEMLNAGAAEQWNAVAGTWVGADWELGESYVTSIEEPIPMFPGFNMPMEYEFSASERIPCTKKSGGKTCVRLEMYSAPDTAQLRKVVGEVMKQLAPELKDAASVLQNMRMLSEIELIAEPGTLRPHSITRIKRVIVNTAEKGKAPEVNRRVDVRTARYRYDL